ncbi:MAG: sigma-70 factor domain-containing protein, partial [Verrucomicrobiota bacterium]|nr:sigma-70 factor domain-containing protein [Verrucomicrobiota bacterium]
MRTTPKSSRRQKATKSPAKSSKTPTRHRHQEPVNRVAPAITEITEPEPRPTWQGTEDALQRYLREMAEVDLLTIEQENELAAKIKKGDSQAREHMIRANLRLVVKIAREYEGLGLP